MSYCQNTLYIAWTQANQEIGIGWGTPGEQFSHWVIYQDTAFEDGNDGHYAAPAIGCWKSSTGDPNVDQTRLWIAFTGTNRKLYYGYFLSTDEDAPQGTLDIHWHKTLKNGTTEQMSPFSTAMSVQGATLRIGWVNPGSHNMHFASTTNALTWFNFNNWTTQSAGAGFGMALYCLGTTCNIEIAWPANDSSHSIYIGYFSLAGGNWHLVNNADPLPDKTCGLCDLTLLAQGTDQQGTDKATELRLPYAGANVDMNVLKSTSGGTSWNNDFCGWFAVFGASGAILPGNRMWITWPDHAANTAMMEAEYN
jgi:hypothetical protein